jgi:serine protease Do
MKVVNSAALACAAVLAVAIVPGGAVRAQSRDTLVRAFDSRGSRIGATLAVEDADNKDAKGGVSIETVEPGGPADRAGIKAGDAVTEFDGERVRSVRQFLRLVQESTPGRGVPVVLSRAGQRVTVNVTPERLTLSDDFGFRYLDGPIARLAIPPSPPPPPAAPVAPRAPRPPAMLFDMFGLRNGGRLGVTVEDLDSQLAEYFGVKDGVLVKTVAEDSAAKKAGLKAGDVITSVNGRHIYDSSDVTRAIDRVEGDGDVTIEVMRDRKTQTLKGKLESRESRARTRVRTTA